MAYFVNGGYYVTYHVPSGTTLKAGDVVSLNSGGLIGIAVGYAEAGSNIAVSLSGNYKIDCGSSAFTCTLGAPAYWDTTNNKVVATVPAGSTFPQLGIFAEALTSSTAGEVLVLLLPTAITKTTSAG